MNIRINYLKDIILFFVDVCNLNFEFFGYFSWINSFKTLDILCFYIEQLFIYTFFIDSGLLVAYLTFRRMDKANGYPIKLILMGYLHRYLR